jgi:tRNA threonylcarbamoyladenosine biosynthesis protein TsaB
MFSRARASAVQNMACPAGTPTRRGALIIGGMTRGLAIETSGRVGSIAVAADGRALAEEQFGHGLKHAAGIVPIVDRLFAAEGWSPGDLEEIYVSAGPGSFTGLRVGITVAKTLAFATGARVVAVPSVDVLARNAPARWANLVIVLDAKRGQIFTASFANRDGQPVPREPARLDTLAAVLARTPRPVHLLGEGLPYHEAAIPPGDAQVIRTPPETWQGRASVVAMLGAELARAAHFTDPARLTPTYIRRPEAEEKYDERRRAAAGA